MDKEKIKKTINPLYMDGLSGRMLRMNSVTKKNREILLLYGHHSSLERMGAFAELMSRYGNVTMPDLPGFGGMDSFYKINELPTLDNYADYLAALIKLRFKRKKATIVAMSFSVPVAIRMLQKYPELTKRVELIISIAGFVHKEDFSITKKYNVALRLMSFFGKRKYVSLFLSKFIVRASVIRLIYAIFGNIRDKTKDANKVERKRRINFEISLWEANDLRTWMFSLGEILNIDVCGQKVNVPMHQISPENDIYFDDKIVEQHMQIIFDDFTKHKMSLDSHAPSVVASAEELDPYIPKGIHKLLSRPAK